MEDQAVITCSDTIYVTGISKFATDQEVIDLLTSAADPNYGENNNNENHEVKNQQESSSSSDAVVYIDITKRFTGRVWAKFATVEITRKVIMKLHQQRWHGVHMSVKFELGKDSNGRQIKPPDCHNTIIRSICDRRGVNEKKRRMDKNNNNNNNRAAAVTYSGKSLFVGDTEYPFPTGLYLTRVISLLRKKPSDDPLVHVITDQGMTESKSLSFYNKEITEAMSMVDAAERAIKLTLGKQPNDISNCKVYVLGDGKRPICCSCLCVHLPEQWQYYSIDPILEPVNDLGPYEDRFHQLSCKSQDVIVEDQSDDYNSSNNNGGDMITLVVACHSHAPLQEFWDRVKGRKIAITMACCSDYVQLDIPPVFEFDDFEVYSPKRNVKIYYVE